MDSGTYRDGFSTDADTTATLIPILAFINMALGVFDAVAARMVTVSQSTVLSQWNYPIPSGQTRIADVAFTQSGRDLPLNETTLQDLQARIRDWRYDLGVPNQYMIVGSEIWLHPVPIGTGPLKIHAGAISPELVTIDDVPVLLPYCHDAIALLAAMLLINSDSENPGRESRLSFLLSFWETRFADFDRLIHARSLLGLEQRQEGGEYTERKLGG